MSKFKGNGIVIRMGATRDDVEFMCKDGGLKVLQLPSSYSKRGYRRRSEVIHEIVTDWKKERYDLPLASA